MSRITFEALYDSYLACRRGKRKAVNTQRYEMQLLDNLHNTAVALQRRDYQPKPSLCFVAAKPKARQIHAADFSDRVVHHWLVPKLEVLYEPLFIHDVYSNRQGKGTHKAVARLQYFMQSQRGKKDYFLQLDIANFFNTINRKILFSLLQLRLKKSVKQSKLSTSEAIQLRWLSYTLLKHDTGKHSYFRGSQSLKSRIPEHKRLECAGDNKGLPIGNLTSQFFANVYLNELDQFIKHQLKCRCYLRYVDDFIILGETPEALLSIQQKITQFLATNLQLSLRPQSIIKANTQGADFLGYIIRPHYKLVRRRVIGNLRDKLGQFQQIFFQKSNCKAHILHDDYERLRATLASYWGHFNYANSYHLRQQVLCQFRWLSVLFDFEDILRPTPRLKPHATVLSHYKSQCDWFRRCFPAAKVTVQRGLTWDVFQPLARKVSLGCFPKAVVIVEHDRRYRGGLKQRFIRDIQFNRSIL